MRIVTWSGPHPLLAELFAAVLEPSFPPAELGTLSGLAEPGRLIRAALDDDGRVLGGAVGDWDPESRVLMLSYLALRPGVRGGGIGGKLLDDAVAAWRAEYEPCLILAEVEDPAAHAGAVVAHGDPAARLRFYQRRGARALELPYFQPALGPGGERVPGLLLMVLSASPEFFVGADLIDPGPVRSYLEDYFLADEGAIPTDPEATALWRALDRPGVPLAPLR